MNRPRAIFGYAAIVLSALLVVGGAFLAFRGGGKAGAPNPPAPIATVAPQPNATSPGLLMREDLTPDPDAYYRAWDLALYDAQGQSVHTSAFYGAPLVLMYWASWCPDCQAVMPSAGAMAEAAASAGARFELVARTGVRGETAETAAKYLLDNGLKMRTLLDDGGAMYDAMGIGWVPTLLFFDDEGVLMYAAQGTVDPGVVAAGVEYAEHGGMDATADFIQNRLTFDGGGIAANFEVAADGAVAPANEVLSETMGLSMEYACARRDEALFARSYGYLSLYIAEGRIPWQILDGAPAKANATLDDLRVLDGLISAERLWGGYREALTDYALGLARGAAPNGELRDFFEEGGVSNALTLCYVDIAAMERLAAFSAEWAAIGEKAKAILLGGYLSDDFPLYAVRYDYDNGRYSGGEYIHMSEAMTTVYNLAKADLLPARTHEYLLDRLRAGKIYAAYDEKGNVLPGYAYESTATYALLAMIGCELDDEEMVRLALRRMEEKRIVDGSAANGSYAVRGERNYAFDTMLALQAWEAILSKGFIS